MPRPALTVSFDNLGEVADLARGLVPEDEPLGRHFSVTRALPRVLEVLEDLGLRATFFVEGLNTELYPSTLIELVEAGHEVAYHGWCHEQWSDLDRGRERELLERGLHAMGRLGVDLRGFRPPGGRLTDASLELLAELGFMHCSPAGDGIGVRDGIAVLPFRWELVDAYYALPRFEALRGSEQPPPRAIVDALQRGLADVRRRGGHLSLLFHPFLLEERERFAVFRECLEVICATEVRRAPYVEIAAAPPRADELRLDLTPA